MKKSSCLLVVKGNLSQDTFCGEQETISFEDFKKYFKGMSVFRRAFSYKLVGLNVYQSEFLSFPLITIMMLRFVSQRNPFIIDKNNERKHITLYSFWLALERYASDWCNKNSMIRQVEARLSEELRQFSVAGKACMAIHQANAVYLRTDLWFGVFSGGSVGHIAGVLNELNQLSGKTIFLSTDFVSTVRKEVATNLLRPTKRFWDFGELPSLASNICFEQQAIDVIGKVKPSFIYQRYSLNNFTGVSLSRRYGIPFVLEYNGSEIWIARNWGSPLKYEALSEKIENVNLYVADVVVVVSQPMKDELIARHVDAEKILVNPNGVDPERYSPEIDGGKVRKQYGLEEKLVIGFIGTFGHWHGAEVLAEAFGRLLQRRPNYRAHLRLLMIGDGVTLPQVKAIIAMHGLGTYCTFAGVVPQAEGPNCLAACDILASPHVPNPDGTPFFGSPTKIFEYMAMGKGIVASDLDQIGDVLSHDKTAWMVKPGDADELATGLERLADDSALRDRLGRAARSEVIEKYTWREHTRRIIDKLKERCGG